VIWRRLKHLASIAMSNVDKKTVSDEQSVRLCNYTDVYYNERITAELPFMEATASVDQIARFGLRAGDVLLTKNSETPDDIAVPAYVVADLPDVVCGYHLALLRPSREVDGRYLFWALSSRSSREQFSASANGITRFGLRYDSFSEVLVPLPPIATQRAIADYLDRETARIDALIEKEQRMKELLQERRQALITEAISRSHDPGAAMEVTE
jgi:type I restriction enzyme S subunit